MISKSYKKLVVLSIMAEQSEEFKEQGISLVETLITCPECKKKRSLLLMYRCFRCGIFVCIDCINKHFGARHGNIPDAIRKKLGNCKK